MSIPPHFHSHSDDKVTGKLHHQRLLLDIHELVTKPYPKITLYPCDDNIYEACLVLSPDNYAPLHLTVYFPRTYPVQPPNVSMNSSVQHPNVYGGFICATILKPGVEYTPAYTLKGIAIQLLSFFDSDSLEQEDGGGKRDLAAYQELNNAYLKDTYQCSKCYFGYQSRRRETWKPIAPTSFDARVSRSPGQWPSIQSSACSVANPGRRRPQTPSGIELSGGANATKPHNPSGGAPQNDSVGYGIDKLPNEILLLIVEQLEDFEQLTSLARAWPRIGRLIRDFDVIRRCELQCFCLKTTYQSTKLGVGVAVERGQISSEFDLISEEAYTYMGVRRSIQSIRFRYWLPIPISRAHWNRVREQAHQSLSGILHQLGRLPPWPSSGTSDAYVIFTFMNDVVVRLNQVTEKMEDADTRKSTLRHASEKAIESYFHLFHLLVCLATEDGEIVRQANRLLRDFEAGKRSKADCPNLGHLLIALLISDVEVTEDLIKSIITETITRNVVWLLDGKGAGMAELAYMERDAVSAYRLDQTFVGSRTSYRLLMFSELFRRTARPSHAKPLDQVRDELFGRHGGPPRDAAGCTASTTSRPSCARWACAASPRRRPSRGCSGPPSTRAWRVAIRDGPSTRNRRCVSVSSRTLTSSWPPRSASGRLDILVIPPRAVVRFVASSHRSMQDSLGNHRRLDFHEVEGSEIAVMIIMEP